MKNELTILPMSIATFEVGKEHAESGDELFFLYSEGFENGPGINRDGKGPPWMEDRDCPVRKITHPVEQRRGTWLIDRGEAKEIEKDTIMRAEDIDSATRLSWVQELDQTPNYFNEFSKRYPDYEIIGMQGSGNISMNGWFVAYLNSEFTSFRYNPGNGKTEVLPSQEPRLLHLLSERYSERTYSCLVKWKTPHPGNGNTYSIEDVGFNLLTKKISFFQDGLHRDITDEIEFAVFGQKLVENGELVDFASIADQFADVRHLYKLPNINPNKPLSPQIVSTRKTLQLVQPNWPRMLFGEKREHDVWFGECQMINPDYIDLLTHALTEPVLLDITFNTMGADWGLIEATFHGTGYRRIQEKNAPPRARGEWRQYSDKHVQIFLQRNVYAYTMFGLDSHGDIVASAAGGQAGRIGQTLESMAQNMISSGCRQVLLIDEGNDVFQWIHNRGYTVLPKRGRIRAVFIFARKKRPERKTA